MSTAFDKVLHKPLIWKLSSHGFYSSVHTYISSFLFNQSSVSVAKSHCPATFAIFSFHMLILYMGYTYLPMYGDDRSIHTALLNMVKQKSIHPINSPPLADCSVSQYSKNWFSCYLTVIFTITTLLNLIIVRFLLLFHSLIAQGFQSICILILSILLLQVN